ncbi:hypothetical protein MPH_00677 [Macrophomina phaseolina MS6]|uniref:Uncharacterized protein n=1 Tax=Macrophomina phaseolina (strain MS6) TaxID=1126212 RepID=K2SZD5_MACPH|nr:hypothetical protein MPH_00677 [Macrophomina phaseolina MS6]
MASFGSPTTSWSTHACTETHHEQFCGLRLTRDSRNLERMGFPVDSFSQSMHVRKGAIFSLLYIGAVALQLFEILGHVCEPMEMRREKSPTAVDMVEMMQACIADSDAVLRGGTPADFIHNDLRKIPCQSTDSDFIERQNWDHKRMSAVLPASGFRPSQASPP